MKEKYFFLDESPSYPGKYLLRLDCEKFYCKVTLGSYNIMPARLLGLTYASYLRFCRDVLGAEIIGKGHLYPLPYFKNDAISRQFVKYLNSLASLIIFEREHPTFEEDKKIVEEYRSRLNQLKKFKE